MKIDLHTHASERSGCSIATQEEQIAAAKEVGLDGLVFTDHDRLVPRDVMEHLREKHDPFRIFTGIEVTTVEGEHVLVIGVYDESLQHLDWTYEDLHSFVREKEGFIAVAHPGRFHPFELDLIRFRPDAIELASCNIREDMVPAIEDLVEHVGCPYIMTSDAHRSDYVGMNYLVLDRDVQTDAELVTILRAGDFQCVNR